MQNYNELSLSPPGVQPSSLFNHSRCSRASASSGVSGFGAFLLRSRFLILRHICHFFIVGLIRKTMIPPTIVTSNRTIMSNNVTKKVSCFLLIHSFTQSVKDERKPQPKAPLHCRLCYRPSYPLRHKLRRLSNDGKSLFAFASSAYFSTKGRETQGHIQEI